MNPIHEAWKKLRPLILGKVRNDRLYREIEYTIAKNFEQDDRLRSERLTLFEELRSRAKTLLKPTAYSMIESDPDLSRRPKNKAVLDCMVEYGEEISG